MPYRWWGVTFAPIPERVRYCPNPAKLYPSGGCKINFCGAVVIEKSGVYLQRLPTKGDAKTHTMRYHKQSYPKANKPVRHEAMMAIRPSHVRMIKYVTGANNRRVLTVFFGRFELNCIISGKHANDYTTSVRFKHEYGDSLNTVCTIAVNSKWIREYSWSDSTGPMLGHYWSGDVMTKIYLNDCLTVEDYEIIRETIAWTWGVIDSGSVSFPIGDYKSVSNKSITAQ